MLGGEFRGLKRPVLNQASCLESGVPALSEACRSRSDSHWEAPFPLMAPFLAVLFAGLAKGGQGSLVRNPGAVWQFVAQWRLCLGHQILDRHTTLVAVSRECSVVIWSDRVGCDTGWSEKGGSDARRFECLEGCVLAQRFQSCRDFRRQVAVGWADPSDRFIGN